MESLNSFERFWADRRDWLKEKGYVLRPRYQEGWVPSWKGTKKYHGRCEDGIAVMQKIMDATRIQDGNFVMMKQIRKKDHPFEVDLATWLSAEPQRSDPQNHCVPIYEVLQLPDDPDMHILVMLRSMSLGSTQSEKSSRSLDKSSRYPSAS
ncbi:hypothetical protein B0H11DRAFT_2078783 [Mycena galericulata]|nr:hypothetical protein B0H11DRAFT_2078783 [Mycena galericulata]